MQELDQRDRELLGALQAEIPFVSTPYAVIGQTIDMSEKEVLKRSERLRRDGVIKQLSPQFDPRALGYRSCLVAASVNPERIDEAAAIVNAHPGVTQNYRRNHDYNLWFTLFVSPLSKLGLEKTIDVLGRDAECDSVRALPTLRLYKSSAAEAESQSDGQNDATPLTPLELEAVRLLQRDLPLQPRPFDVLARGGGGISADDLVTAARALLKRGQIRRFCAQVQARKPGFGATVMGVWIVPENDVDAYAAKLAQHRAVSHCYLRPVYEDWPYNVYTTVHGRSVDECESIINDLATDSGLTQKRALFPVKEYKKARVSFFSHDAEEWEEAHGDVRIRTTA